MPKSPTVTLTPVNGCAACGVLARAHGMSYDRDAGLHPYITPTDVVRRQRLLTRQALSRS